MNGETNTARKKHWIGLNFVTITCLIGFVAAIIFVGFPKLDIWTSGLFYVGHNRFVGQLPGAIPKIRVAFQLLFITTCITAILGTLIVTFSRQKFFGLGFPHWIFVTLCLIIGPGLIANVMLKDHWGRARPVKIEQFGGELTFTPALERSDQCRTNCSFVAGEAASIYAAFFAFGFLMTRRRKQALALGVVAGSIAGLIRIAGGGHFLSDVIFAGVFMALVVRSLYWIIFDAAAPTFAEDGPVHMWLYRAGQAVKSFGAALWQKRKRRRAGAK